MLDAVLVRRSRDIGRCSRTRATRKYMLQGSNAALAGTIAIQPCRTPRKVPQGDASDLIEALQSKPSVGYLLPKRYSRCPRPAP